MSVKFSDAARIRVQGDTLRSESGLDLAPLIELATALELSFEPLLRVDPDALRDLERRAELRTGKAQPDLAGVAEVELRAPREQWQAIASRLQSLDLVEFVSIDVTDTPAPQDFDPMTADLSGYQSYFGPDPGIDVDAAWALGLRGGDVRVSDIEKNWRFAHEDLVDLGVTLEPNLVIEPELSPDHGCAVLGILAAGDNGYGVRGIAPDVSPFVYPTNVVVYGDRRYAAVVSATMDSAPGDVLVFEMQRHGIAVELYVPAEYDPLIHMATQVATDAGVVVVAAAGNGNQDLDSSDYADYAAFGDSGALIVGAGTADVFHSKRPYSSYGQRVNVQGWGHNVATTCDGDLEIYGDDPNQAYTDTFGGTSSATALVAGAVTLVQEYARERGLELGPYPLRELLVSTGVPQGSGGHIGPLPDLAAALEVLTIDDVTPPSVTVLQPGPGPDLWIEADTFEADILISATDDTLISEVYLDIAGQEQPWVGRSAPYEVAGVGFPVGDWQIRARAVDIWGNVGESEVVTVHVGQAEPPSGTGDATGTGDETGMDDETGTATGDPSDDLSEGDMMGCRVVSSPRRRSGPVGSGWGWAWILLGAGAVRRLREE